MFPLIDFSVGKYAWLQVDLLVRPRKRGILAARSVMKAAAGPRMNASG